MEGNVSVPWEGITPSGGAAKASLKKWCLKYYSLLCNRSHSCLSLVSDVVCIFDLLFILFFQVHDCEKMQSLYFLSYDKFVSCTFPRLLSVADFSWLLPLGLEVELRKKDKCIALHNWTVLGLYFQVWLDIGANDIIRIRTLSISYSLLSCDNFILWWAFSLNDLLFPNNYKGNSRTESFWPDLGHVPISGEEVWNQSQTSHDETRGGADLGGWKTEAILCSLLSAPRISPCFFFFFNIVIGV